MSFALALPLAALAQDPGAPTLLPDTPVGKAVALFVKALNAGSIQELEKFHTDRGGPAEAAQQDLGFAQQSGGLELQKVLEASSFDIEVEATTRKTGRVVVLHCVIEPTPPHAVAEIGVRPAGARGAGGPSGSPD